MQYEVESSHLSRLIRAEHVQGMTFVRHMHHSFEFFYVKQGQMSCTVENVEYILNAGDAVLVLPNQLHSYHTPVFSDAIMLIFDPLYVNEFYKYVHGKEFVCPIFRPTAFQFGDLPDSQDFFAWKSLLYSLCSQANQQATLRASTQKNNHLIQQVFAYIYAHIDSKLWLEQLAEHVGYSYHYLSNCIKENFGMNFCTLVNHCRIDLAATLLRTTDLTMTQVADKSGFSTIRSFNRAFKQIHGETPSQFAHKIKSE